MVEKPSLVSHFLPNLEEWWSVLLASPWLTLVFVILTLVSVRRHGELAYGTYHAKLLGLILLAVYLVGQVLLGISSTNLGFIAMLLVVTLSDSIVVSISRSRSTYFVYDLGLVLALLFLIHPAFLILSLFFVDKLRMINSASIKHILAYIAGHLTILALATMLFATRSWEGVLLYWKGWIVPMGGLSFPHIKEIPLLLFDTIYLAAITLGVLQVIRSSTVRVRKMMSYHLQLSWVLMLIHLVYGLRGGTNYAFLIPSLFLSGGIADYLLTQRQTKWLSLALLLILTATVGIRVWLYFAPPVS